jgi:predicted amidophosphoribosyltransferase
MSTANNPSPWYSGIVNYKNGGNQSHTLVASLVAAYIAEHLSRINALLGDDYTQIVVVPSTRGRAFAVHPLPQAIRRIIALKDRISDSLSHVPGSTIGRQEYNPSIFAVDASSVRDGRIVLIEDLWVSGSKAVSAAGALLQAGASAVVILPIVREYRSPSDFCPQEYQAAASSPYSLGHWPRA